MIIFLNEGGNSELRNRTFPIPKGVYSRLLDTLRGFKGDKTTDGYKRLNNLIKMKTVSYQEMKRLKNFFDHFDGKPESDEYILNGGGPMQMWVNNALSTATQAIRDFKQAKKDAGLSNAFIRPHDKDRQCRTSKPSMSQIRTNDVNRAVRDGEAVKYESRERKIIRLSNAQVRMLKEAQDDTFSLSELSSIPSFRGRVQYCNQHIGRHCGRGSSRMVWQLDDKRVLKLAFNQKGIAQNGVEYDQLLQRMGIVPKIYDIDRNNYWIVSEYVLPAKARDFNECVGLSWEGWCKFIYTAVAIKNGNRRKWGTTVYSEEEFYQMIEDDDTMTLDGFRDYIMNYNVGDYDLTRLANYGMVMREGGPEVVLLDAGLSEEIWNQYYKRR